MPARDFIAIFCRSAKTHHLLLKLFVILTGQVDQGNHRAGIIQEDLNKDVFLIGERTDRIESSDRDITGMVVDKVSNRHSEKSP